MSQPEKTTATTFDLYKVLLIHKRAMAWTFSSIMLVVIAITFLGPKSYTSEAKLFVRIGRESVSLDPTATTGQVVMLNETRENEINSIFELLRSRAILSNVVSSVRPQVVLGEAPSDDKVQTAGLFQSLNVFAPYSMDDEAIRRLDRDLKIAAVRKSNVINISYEAKTPELARDIVSSVIEQARESHGRVNRIQGSHEFFEQQSQTLREKLTLLEKELLERKNSSGISNAEDQRGLHLRHMSELQTKLRTAEASLSASTAEMQAQQASLKAIPETITKGRTTGMPHSATAAMREQLFALQVKEKEILSNYTEAHPQAMLIREQVAALQTVLEREPIEPQVEHGLNSVHQEISLAFLKSDASTASLQAQAAALREQLAMAKAELTELNNNEVEIARLEREIEMETVNYKKYSENLEQARIDHELAATNISNLNVLQPPTYSITPTRPKRAMNLTLGLVAAAACSLAVGLFLEQRRSGLLYRLLWSS